MDIKKPIAFFDLETTGVSVSKDRIVSIAVRKIMPDGSQESKYALINPEMPIPADATAIHGITDEMVKDKPTFKKISKSLYDFFKDCDLAGFNIVFFDLPMISQHFSLCDLSFPYPETKLVDSCLLFKLKESRTLSAAYKFYCAKEMKDAHNAQADVDASIEILEGQMKMYNMSIDEVADFCKTDNRVDLAGRIILDKNGDYVYNFGRSKGKRVKDDITFAQWMLAQEFVTKNTKSVVSMILKKLNEPKLF
jgi:DNA polymerase-3 subunit epsilon